MRVLVATDSIGSLSSRRAGDVLAVGWPGATVLPVGDAGSGFVTALADRLGVEVRAAAAPGGLVSTAHVAGLAAVAVEGVTVTDGIPHHASSLLLGESMAELLAERRTHRLLVDLAGSAVHDGGAGLLAALGATADADLTAGVAGLGDVTRLDLSAVVELVGDTELVGVVPADQLSQPLLGLRGITSLRGRDAGTPPELMLRTDAALEQFAGLVDAAAAQQPGAGACGGLGFVVLALGGRLTTGPALAFESVDLRGVDLVVTGCSVFDFANRGGGVVAAAAEAAARVLAPCLVVAGEVLIGSREMRTMGIEAAYAVRESSLDEPLGAVTESELAATAARVARSWRW